MDRSPIHCRCTLGKDQMYFWVCRLRYGYVFAHKDNYPSAWSKNATAGLLEAERQIFLLGYEKAFLLNQTCCGICGDCKGNRMDCVDKKHSRPSPEAFAVDVYSLVRNTGMEIHVIPDSPSQISRIALLMVD